MKNLRTTLLSGLTVSVAAVSLAVAQSPAPAPAAPAFASDDADADASPMTRAERRAERRDRTIDADTFGERRLERMRAADSDGNGELSRAELEALALQQMAERRATRMERRLDINGDGTVTLAEIENHQTKRFAYFDRNEDGELDRREMRRARAEMKGGKEGHGPRHRHADRSASPSER